MKQLYLALILLVNATGAFSQTNYTYTAKKSGSWNDMTLWNITPRPPAATKSLVMIPAAFTVTVDNGVNSFGLGNVEINLLGTLNILNGTSVNLSPSSTMEIFGAGKIVGTNATQVITIGGIVKYDGSKDKTKSGGWIATPFTGVSPLGFVSTAVLPVQLMSFNAIKSNDGVLVRWVTSAEIANDHFELERSVDGATWTRVASVKAVAAAGSTNTYSFTDKNSVSPVFYYRLKQVDINGRFSYSEVRKFSTAGSITSRVYLVSNVLKVELANHLPNAVVTVVQPGGNLLGKRNVDNRNSLSFNLAETAHGILYVNISDSKELNQTTSVLF